MRRLLAIPSAVLWLGCAGAPVTPAAAPVEPVVTPASLAPPPLAQAMARLHRVRTSPGRPPRGAPMPTALAVAWAEVLQAPGVEAFPPGPPTADEPYIVLRDRLAEALAQDLLHYGDIPPALAVQLAELAARLDRLRASPPRFDWPVQVVVVTSGFGERVHPFTGDQHAHDGVDLLAEPGQPVLAAAEGQVVFAGASGARGNHVELAHGPRARTRYSHLSRLMVSPGAHVRRGQRIGDAGATGRVTGPHLHFELVLDGVAVDPRRHLDGAAVAGAAR